MSYPNFKPTCKVEPKTLMTLVFITVEGQVEHGAEKCGTISSTEPPGLSIHHNLHPVLAGVVILDDEVCEVQTYLSVLIQSPEAAGAVQVRRILIGEVWS